jgi:hypothetical protein
MSKIAIESRSGGYPLWIIVPALAVVLLLIVWGRVYYGSCQSYREGMAHLENQELVRAVTYFDRSIHWYTPFNPWVRKSSQRLWEIGENAERDGDTRLALIAYRTIRQGFYAARSVYQPGKDWIRRSEQRIAQLVRQETGALPPSLPSQEMQDPDVFWSIVVVLGLFGWVGSVSGFIMAQWGPWSERKSSKMATLLCTVGFLVFFAVWMLGMMRA